eukprot:GHUV01052121.1.p1 GENE.GHUV01052121.1~~GHUV01052121.1.p1  ORF type:complete len:116 (+),score=24.75 GHUV01052121.1:2-349(+)
MSLMCHEVRTPLNGCLASAEMLLETPLKEEQRELANTIRVSGSILLSTVSNFLDFFKLEVRAVPDHQGEGPKSSLAVYLGSLMCIYMLSQHMLLVMNIRKDITRPLYGKRQVQGA